MAQVLKSAACGLAIAAPNTATNPTDSAVTVTDATTALDSGEAVGYLHYAVTAGPGTWGTLTTAGAFAGRGTLNPVNLGFPPPGTLANLGSLPAGTTGNCAP